MIMAQSYLHGLLFWRYIMQLKRVCLASLYDRDGCKIIVQKMAYFVVLLLLTAAHDTYGTIRSVESKAGRESRDGNSGPGSYGSSWMDQRSDEAAMDTLSPLAEETVHALLSTIYEFQKWLSAPSFLISCLLFCLYWCFWQITCYWKNILKIDSLLYIAYAWCSPELVLRYFQKSLYWASLVLYTLIVSEHRSSWAILFLWHREIMYVLVNLLKAMSALDREVRRLWRTWKL